MKLQKTNTFAKVKRRVYSAIGRVAGRERSGRLVSQEHATNFGVSRSRFLAASRTSAKYSNAKIEKFCKLSKEKRLANLQLGKGRGFFPREKLKKAASQHPPLLRDLLIIGRICFIGTRAEPRANDESTTYTVLTGSRRVQTAHLVISETLSFLHASAKDADDDQLSHSIFVFGLGKMVVSRAAWALADGIPTKLPPHEILHHQAMCKTTAGKFLYNSFFRLTFPRTLYALQHCSQVEGSKWTVQKRTEDECETTSSDTMVLNKDLRPLAQQDNRRIVNYLGSSVLLDAPNAAS